MTPAELSTRSAVKSPSVRPFSGDAKTAIVEEVWEFATALVTTEDGRKLTPLQIFKETIDEMEDQGPANDSLKFLENTKQAIKEK